MTSDRETAEAEVVYGTAERMCAESDEAVSDEAVAAESGIDLPTVRRWLAEAGGVRLVVRREGDTVLVEGPVR